MAYEFTMKGSVFAKGKARCETQITLRDGIRKYLLT